MFCFTKETCTTLITYTKPHCLLWVAHTTSVSNKYIHYIIATKGVDLIQKGMASKDFQYEQTASNHSKALLKHSFLHRSSDLHL